MRANNRDSNIIFFYDFDMAKWYDSVKIKGKMEFLKIRGAK